MKINGKEPQSKKTSQASPLKAVATMPDYVLQAYNEIRELRAKGMREDAGHRYDVALRVKRVWECKPEYGQQAMKQLAAALGWSISTAYRYKDVAENFKPDEFDRILEKSDEYGRPLSWQHFIELAKVATDAERQKLLDTVLNDGLSARQLGKTIGTNPPPTRKSQAKRTNCPKEDDVQNLALESEVFAVEVQRNSVRLSESFDNARSRAARRDLRKRITEARNGLLRVSRECQQGIERLDDCLRSDDDHDAGQVLQFSVPFVSAPAMPA